MVERSERRWMWFFAALVVVLTTIPYLIAYQRQGSGWLFTGFVFGVEDGNTYIAKMLRGANGDSLFRSPYVAADQHGALVYLPFLLLGKLTAPPGQHEQMVALYHLFRFGAIFLYVFATYDFLAVFLRETRWRRLGTILATTGSGLGWLSVAGLGELWQHAMPLDFYSPETFGFLMVYGLPHLAFARACLLWGLRDYVRPRSPTLGKKALLRTALTWLGVGLMQPMTIAIGWTVIGAHLLATAGWQVFRWRSGRSADWGQWLGFFWRAVRIGLLSAPLLVYTIIAFQLDPILRNWQRNNILTSPPIGHYLLAYAILLPLALLGIRPLLREQPWQGWLALAWLAILPLLAYAPFSVQRRLTEGVWVAIIVLAMRWLESQGETARRWAPRWMYLALLTPIILILGGAMTAWSPFSPPFRPAGEVKAFDYLARHSRPGDIVLASFDTSNALPAWAPVRVVTGHGPESVNGEAIKKQVSCFYSESCTGFDRPNLLSSLDIHYVFWGPSERALGTWDPRGVAFLRPVYEDEDYLVFQFLSPPSR